jgi:hypothetical protein
MSRGAGLLAVALVGLQQFLPCKYQPPVPQSPLEVRSIPLDLALPPWEMVWHIVPLGGFVIGFVALLPLLLRLFADAIFVNSLLTFRSASAALFSGATFPCRMLVSHCAAWMTIVLVKSFQQFFVVWFLLILSLFSE